MRLAGNQLAPQGPGEKEMLTENQDRIMAEFIADYNGGDAADYLGESGGTRDDFASFDGREWSDWSGRTYEERGGFHAVHYEEAQAIKGQPRVSLWVVDFGDVRGIYQM